MKTIKVEIENKITDCLYQVFASIGFWNEEGEAIYNANLSHKMGSPRTWKFAHDEGMEQFILNNLLCDIEGTVKNTPYICGRSGSHIWVQWKERNVRILLIHF